MADAKKRTLALVAEIDQAELTVRLLDVGCKMNRPPAYSEFLGRAAMAEIR